MMFRARLEKKIKKSIEETVSEYSASLPKIIEHFFYGAIEIAPQYLVIWYLFDRDSDLAEAQASGLCERIRCSTVQHLKIMDTLWKPLKCLSRYPLERSRSAAIKGKRKS